MDGRHLPGSPDQREDGEVRGSIQQVTRIAVGRGLMRVLRQQVGQPQIGHQGGIDAAGAVGHRRRGGVGDIAAQVVQRPVSYRRFRKLLAVAHGRGDGESKVVGGRGTKHRCLRAVGSLFAVHFVMTL